MDRALDAPATRQALRRHRRQSLASLPVAVSLFLGTGALLDAAGYPDEGAVASIAVLMAGASLVVLGLGLFALAASIAMRRALTRHPWRPYRCRFRELPSAAGHNGTPVLVLDDELTLAISSTAWRWRALEACDGREVWFAGDPRRHGVVAPPEGTHLLLARAPISRRRRERLRTAVRADRRV
jgi:hypothetical protein